MAADDAEPLYTMRLLPKPPSPRPLMRAATSVELDTMALPSRPRDDVVPPEAAQLEELHKVRRKFDDGLALCLNLHGERTKLEHELKEKKKVYEEAEQRRRADENGDDGVAAFEKAFDESQSRQGLTIVQKVVVVVAAFLLGFVADRFGPVLPSDADPDADGAGPRVEADFATELRRARECAVVTHLRDPSHLLRRHALERRGRRAAGDLARFGDAARLRSAFAATPYRGRSSSSEYDANCELAPHTRPRGPPNRGRPAPNRQSRLRHVERTSRTASANPRVG